MYLLFVFACSGTLYEPSSGIQILTMVYNDTPTAKEIFELSFFISNAICHQGHYEGDYIKHAALSATLAKSGPLDFPLEKVFFYFLPMKRV